jgi:DNA-binding Xre family transcriptional regulator
MLPVPDLEVLMTDHTPQLKCWMQQARIPSLAALAKAAGVSRRKLDYLRSGRVQRWQLRELLNLSWVLQISLGDLLAGLDIMVMPDHQEYHRLQQQLEQQRQQLLQEFQADSLRAIETWLRQWAKVVRHAQQNSEFRAMQIIPLVRPVENLVASWGVEPIAQIGSTAAYDPQWHQLQQGTAPPGQPVEVVAPGYCHRGKLLHRAEVRPIVEH